MDEDAVRPVPCDSQILETDVKSTNKSNKEVWKLGTVLRGRCGDTDANP